MSKLEHVPEGYATCFVCDVHALQLGCRWTSKSMGSSVCKLHVQAAVPEHRHQ